MTPILAASAFAVPPDLERTWADLAPLVAAHSPVPVPFGPADLEVLREGGVSASRYDTEAGAWATGALWVDAPIEDVWVVLNDGPHGPQTRVSLTRLPAPDGIRLLYQKLDLPYPLSDRQWVAEVRGNPALATATGGAVWQRHWSLADPALAPNPDPSATWIEESRGAWTAVGTPEGTLVLFSVRSVLGGMIPASIANGFAIRTIRESLRSLGERAAQVPTHYTADHERVMTPLGAEIRSR